MKRNETNSNHEQTNALSLSLCASAQKRRGRLRLVGSDVSGRLQTGLAFFACTYTRGTPKLAGRGPPPHPSLSSPDRSLSHSLSLSLTHRHKQTETLSLSLEGMSKAGAGAGVADRRKLLAAMHY
jgi:hypothetical protein